MAFVAAASAMHKQRALSTPSYMSTTAFNRMASQGSAVLGDFLYLDGGTIITNLDHGDVSMLETLNDTLSIPLSTSWTNSTVSFSAVNRGTYPTQPSLGGEDLWLSNDSTSFYTFGGELPFTSIGTPVYPKLWLFTADGNGGGNWSEATSGEDSTYRSLVQPSHALATSGNGLGFALGGVGTCNTYADPLLCGDKEIPIPVYNVSAAGANGYSTSGTAYGGSAQFAPIFGVEGIALFLGGQTTSPTELDVSSPSVSFGQIGIFDPSTRAWYTQSASGYDVPTYRESFCSVGVQGDNGTYEIFIYGGVLPNEQWGEAAASNVTANSMDEIYVLSVPSFTWFKADYSARYNRYAHTCQVVGSRQMLTFGGADWAQQDAATSQSDPFVLGLGIFDMTEMTSKYQTPAIIKSHIEANGPTPSTWSNAAMQQIFAAALATATASASVTATASASVAATAHPKPASISSGDLAGIAIGAVAGLTIVALLSWLFIRRQRRILQSTSDQDQPPLGYHQPLERHELESKTYVHEVESRPYGIELPAQLDAYELSGDSSRAARAEAPQEANGWTRVLTLK
ncbi:hypothetical protein LTR85_009148 [Meristemomyces frigidus]|nr:hypothetical protein LTR85_009148 [Meristemomyces frigidus]